MIPTHELRRFEVVNDPRQINTKLYEHAGRHPFRCERGLFNHEGAVEEYLVACRRDLQAIRQILPDGERTIGVCGSAAIDLPESLKAVVTRQLEELLKELPLPVRHGGFSGIMLLAAMVAHRLTTSIAIRSKINNREQAINNFHHRLAYVHVYALREAAIILRNALNLYFKTGLGGFRELFNPHAGERVIVDVDGFWTMLREFLDWLVDQGLMSVAERALYRFVNHPLEAL